MELLCNHDGSAPGAPAGTLCVIHQSALPWSSFQNLMLEQSVHCRAKHLPGHWVCYNRMCQSLLAERKVRIAMKPLLGRWDFCAHCCARMPQGGGAFPQHPAPGALCFEHVKPTMASYLGLTASFTHPPVPHWSRAEEHLPNTLRQVLIYDALGFPRPVFSHVSLILAPDKSKLSKRWVLLIVIPPHSMTFIPHS
eukprot:scaffold33826_cov24-Tisochrysis_lutea.AAC.1